MGSRAGRRMPGDGGRSSSEQPAAAWGAAVFSRAPAAWQLMGAPGPPESVPREGWRPAAGVYLMLGVCPHWPKWPIPQNVPEPTVLWEEQRCLFQMPSPWVSCFGDPGKLPSRRAQWPAPEAGPDAAGRGVFLAGRAPAGGGEQMDPTPPAWGARCALPSRSWVPLRHSCFPRRERANPP